MINLKRTQDFYWVNLDVIIHKLKNNYTADKKRDRKHKKILGKGINHY